MHFLLTETVSLVSLKLKNVRIVSQRQLFSLFSARLQFSMLSSRDCVEMIANEWNVVLLLMAQMLFPYHHSFLIQSTQCLAYPGVSLAIITGFVIPSIQITAFLVDLEAVAVSAIKCKPDGKKQRSLLNFLRNSSPIIAK